VKLLLDTHVWIWAAVDPVKLGPKASDLLTDVDNELFVSTISTLEIGCLVTSGKVELTIPLADWIEKSLASLDCATLELSHADALEAYSLPAEFHRDPADRILVATARSRGLSLVTADQRILGYPHIKALDARL